MCAGGVICARPGLRVFAPILRLGQMEFGKVDQKMNYPATRWAIKWKASYFLTREYSPLCGGWIDLKGAGDKTLSSFLIKICRARSNLSYISYVRLGIRTCI